MKRTTSFKWYTDDGHTLLEMNTSSTALVENHAFNAPHLRELAAAAIEAAELLEEREKEGVA